MTGKRTYWRRYGDSEDLVRPDGYRLTGGPEGRTLTHNGTVLGTGLTLAQGKALANKHEDENR